MLLLALLVNPVEASRPADLAPGAPELQEGEQRLSSLLGGADATRAAASRLQARWVMLGEPVPDEKGKPKAADPCAEERLEIGWRIERFGAAWREAAQAAHAEAGRVRTIRAAATVAPLVDTRWADRLRSLLERDESGLRAFLEASVWQAQFVRPVLAMCAARVTAPVVAKPEAAPPEDAAAVELPAPPNGEALTFVWERGHTRELVAALAVGDGWICPGSVRADDAVVLLVAEPDGAARACWSASSSCGCAPGAVYPGGVLAAPGE